MEKTLIQQLQKIDEPEKVPAELLKQFLDMIEFCSRPFDFNDENKDIQEKNDRLYYLQQIQDLLPIQNTYPALIFPQFSHIMNMIEINLRRPLPIQKKQAQNQLEPEIDVNDMYVITAWPHQQPIYDIFLQLIVSEHMEVKVLLPGIKYKFIYELFDLFDSNEPREREYIKNIIHRLYGKLVQRRKTFRKAISNIFTTVIHERYSFNGMSELLDVLASVISGFAIPLRDQHIEFFKEKFIPLHKVQTSHFFHEQLQRCSMLYLSKMPDLAVDLLNGLLKYWPQANSIKEMMFLSELLEVLEICEIHKLEPYVDKLFRRLVKCIAGPHLQVSDRAMCFFENEYFLTVLRNYKQIAFPLFIPVINKIADTHWHKILQESLIALRQILKELDGNAFDKALQYKNTPTLYLSKDAKKRAEERNIIEEKWNELKKKAQKINPQLGPCVLPYTDYNVAGESNRLNNANVVHNYN